jgi:multiple sugar transport system ATP-binding protein
MTVRDNMAFSLLLRKADAQKTNERVDHAAKILNLEHLLHRFPRELSGGQRQRVAMGRAIVRDPKVFLFDEPLSNLDAKLRVAMRAEIKALHQRLKTTTVYVTHDQVEAMTLGDRIAVMKDGLVQQFGTPTQIYNHPTNRFVAEFIGSPAMNMVDAQRTGQALTAHGVELAVTGAQRAALQAHGSAELVYGLRPESLGFAAQGLPGKLSMIEPTGPETYATVDTVAGKLTARVPGVLQAAVGDAVHLQWSADQAHVFDRASGVRVG